MNAPGVRLGPYEIVSALGLAAWARCTKPATPAPTARTPTRVYAERHLRLPRPDREAETHS